jgi:hypothetical protein
VSDELRHPTHIKEGESASVASVKINHRSLRHLAKQLQDPLAQAQIRAKYGEAWNRLEVELGKSGHSLTSGVLTLRVNQEQELLKLIKPAPVKNTPTETPSLESEFFSTSVETLRAMLLKGLKGEAPRENIVKLADLMSTFAKDADSEKKIFQPAMQLYAKHYMSQSAHDPIMQGSPARHFYRFLEQCEQGAISTDTQIAFRGFMQAFCRSLAPEHIREKVAGSINSASKLFRPSPTLSLEQVVSSLTPRRAALNELTTLALLAESSLVNRLNSVITKYWDEHYAQFTHTVKHTFFSALSSHDDGAAERAAEALRTHGHTLTTPGTNQYLMTLQLESDNKIFGAEASLGRFSRELDIFLAAHRELAKHPITESEALELVERWAAPSLEWLAGIGNNASTSVPECADACARSVAQVALASGGPQEHLFCQITWEILEANAHISDPTMPVQIYCMLASFKKYYDLVSNEIAPLQKNTALLLGWSLTGTLDVIATDITRQISASSPDTPLSEIEALYQRLTNIISLLQRPKTGVLQGQEIKLSGRLSTTTHFVESRRFMTHVSAGALGTATKSLSYMRELRAGFQDESKTAMLEAENREQTAEQHLIEATHKSVERLAQYLDDGNLGKAIILLQELNDTAELLPDCVGTPLRDQLSRHRHTFEEVVKEYWESVVQPRIETAANYIQKRKKEHRLAEPLSSEEKSCLSSLFREVNEIRDAWVTVRDFSPVETLAQRASSLDTLLSEQRNRYNLIVSEWRLCPAARKVLPSKG